MDSYQANFREETAYLENTIALIKNELTKEIGDLANTKQKLISARKEMWENTSHSGRDFTRRTEMNQYLTEVNAQTLYI